MEEKEVVSKNFIELAIDKDLAEGVYDHVMHTIPAGAKRLSSYRTCKIHPVKLRFITGVQRRVPHAFR